MTKKKISNKYIYFIKTQALEKILLFLYQKKTSGIFSKHKNVFCKICQSEKISELIKDYFTSIYYLVQITHLQNFQRRQINFLNLILMQLFMCFVPAFGQILMQKLATAYFRYSMILILFRVKIRYLIRVKTTFKELNILLE